MSTTPAIETPASVVALRDARWDTRWLLTGLAFLLLWRCVPLIGSEWLSQFPSWLLLIATGLAPQAFLLIFPVLTRRPNACSTFGVPAPRRLLLEFGITIPVVIGVIVGLGAANYLVERIFPGTSLAADATTNVIQTQNRTVGYFLLLFSFTFAPIAEEVFFRGFLYNAFRARMPLVAAGLVQSLIFGFGHFYGLKDAAVASVLGLLLTAVYQWRKTLITPIFVHAGINWIAAIGTLLGTYNYANSAAMGVTGDPKDTECIVRQIAPKSAAEKAGLQVGDIITAFNAEPIHNFPHLRQVVPKYRAGDTISLTIIRSGRESKVSVVLQKPGDP